MDPTPKKWWSGWPEWLTGVTGRWCHRYRSSAAERRLTQENGTLRSRVEELQVEIHQAHLDLESAQAEAKAQKDMADYLESIMARHREQLTAEIAITARQTAEGRVDGNLRRSGQ